jgi:hypothetical protein
MDQHGFTIGGIGMPWTAVKKVEVDRYHQLRVGLKRGGPIVLGRVDKIENFFLFCELATDALQGNTGHPNQFPPADAPSGTAPPEQVAILAGGLPHMRQDKP